MERPAPDPGEPPALAPHEHHLMADVEPLDVTGVSTVRVGTALWVLTGLVLLLFFQGWLHAHGHRWWLWTCVAGTGVGLFGIWYCRRRARHLPPVQPPSVRG